MPVRPPSLESVIGRLVHTFNREMLDLSAPPEYTPLPPPGDGQRHLLYLHIPYCHVLCPFCSFHRVQFKQNPAIRYFDRLRRECEIVGDAGYVFDELYIGGGTPTVLPDLLFDLIGALQERHPVRGVSIETNPDDLRKASIGLLADAGVSRLSVGVQSFDDALLREIRRYDRYGSGADIRAAIAGARGCFDTLNVDMIFNFPHQAEQSLARDLDILVDELGVDQVSYYPLMNVDNAEKTMEQAIGRVEYSRERDFYELIAERLLRAGYTRNSSWCFSRKAGMSDEYIVDREQYVGLGSGAFSYLGGALYSSTFSIGEYERMVDEGQTGTVFRQRLNAQDQKRYYLLMELFGGRLDKRQAERRFGRGFERALWRELAALKVLGALRDRGEYLELTERGNYLWVVMMREFFSGVNRLREKMRHEGRHVTTVRDLSSR